MSKIDFNIDWKEELKFSKRKVVIFLIAFLSTLLVAMILLSGFLYQTVHRWDELEDVLDKIRKDSGESTTLATDILDEVGAYFDKYALEELDKEELFEALKEAFDSKVSDKYYALYTKEEHDEVEARFNGEGVGIGCVITAEDNGIRIVKVYKDSPAKTAGIIEGDLLIEAGGTSLVGVGASEARSAIQGETGTDVVIKLLRNDEEMTVTATRGEYKIETVFADYQTVNEKKIAIITIDSFYYDTDEDFKEIVSEAISENVQGFIFDVRDNGGGSLETVVNMLDYLLPEGPIVHLTYKNSQNTMSSDANYATDVPFVVLVNGGTASAAELFTSTLKDYERATIVGTQTYGKGCGQQTFTLPSGYYLKVTTFKYDPPYSENYDGVGVEPDVVLEKEKDLDNQMSKALEILTK